MMRRFLLLAAVLLVLAGSAEAGGRRLAVLKEGRLSLVSVPDGRRVSVARELSVDSFCFSPDGERMALLGSKASDEGWPQDIWELTLRTGKLRRVTRGFWPDGAMAWQPGSSSVAVSRFPLGNVDGDGGVWLVDMRTGKSRRLVPGADADFPIGVKAVLSRDGRFMAVDRCGNYAPVLEVARPGRWFGLDKPKELMERGGSFERPYGYLDFAWSAGHRLLIASISMGLWEWNLDGCRAGIRPIVSLAADRPKTGNSPAVSARLVADRYRTVYCVDVDPKGNVMYLDNAGLWRLPPGGTPVQVLTAAQIPELKSLREGAIETGFYGIRAQVRTSPDGRYAFLMVNWVGMLVDVGQRKVLGQFENTEGSW